jgi:HAMP domain-containing protein
MLKLRTCLLLLIFASTMASAQNYYRYYDQNGTVVINSWVPPQFVDKGYTILDAFGNVIDEVKPVVRVDNSSLSAEELAALEKRAYDANLMKIYRSARDVERAKDTVLGRFELELSFISNRMNKRLSELYDLQSQAAEQERTRKEVSQELIDEISQAENEIKVLREQIADNQARKNATIASFDRDRDRVQWIVDRREELLDSILTKRAQGLAPNNEELDEFLQLQFKEFD